MEIFLAYILPALIAAAAAIGGSAINYESQKQTNEDNLAYSQSMTEKQWNRDDTSLQRQVEDAKAAGLSPLAVTGSMNSSSPLNYAAQAPQMDIASLVGAFSSFENVSNGYEKYMDRKTSSDQFDKELTHDLYKFNEQLKASKELQDDQLANEIIKLNKTLAYNYDQLNEMSLQNAQNLENDRLQYLSEQSMQIYNSVAQTCGLSPRVEYVTDYKEYLTKFNSFMVHYKELLNDPNLIDTGYTTQASQSEAFGSSASKLGLNIQSSASQSYEVSSAVLRDLYASYIKDYAIPILVDDKKFTSREYKYDNVKVE